MTTVTQTSQRICLSNDNLARKMRNRLVMYYTYLHDSIFDSNRMSRHITKTMNDYILLLPLVLSLRVESRYSRNLTAVFSLPLSLPFIHLLSIFVCQCHAITSTQSSNGVLDQFPCRPRFVTTVPIGVFLPPTKELPPVKHPNASNDVRTYAYFSVPKVFAQQRNIEGPITEIHAIQALATSLHIKPISKR